jgi:hypothetical protein
MPEGGKLERGLGMVLTLIGIFLTLNTPIGLVLLVPGMFFLVWGWYKARKT